VTDQTEERPTSSQDGRRSLNVFFDVDNTLIMWNGKLRNHTEHVFQQLKDAGHTIYVWSGVGIRRWDMKRHDLDKYVTDYFIKPLEKLDSLGVPMIPDYVIDDHKTVVDAFGGYHIPDMAKPDDEELLKVLAEIMEMAAVPTLGDTEEPGEQVALG
jgi:FMN phosphatase YigB (HAD superfamily)